MPFRHLHALAAPGMAELREKGVLRPFKVTRRPSPRPAVRTDALLKGKSMEHRLKLIKIDEIHT